MPRFSKPMSREESLADDPLKEFFVWWMDVKKNDADLFEECLNCATKEEDVQAILQQHPILLIQHLGGGHGRYVIPKKKLGAEYVPDFVIGHRHSGGYEWEAVELESPNARLFTKSGNPSSTLTHAIKQIQDWRSWLRKNQNYAERPPADHGLGLTDIVCDLPGLILIGRRKEEDGAWRQLRRQMVNDLNIRIHSFDFLLDNALAEAIVWEEIRKERKRPVAKKPDAS